MQILGKEKQEQIVSTIRTAGTMISDAKLEQSQIYDKEGAANFVTKYDKQIQSYLIDAFSKILPEAHYLAEEDGIQDQVEKGYCFIIDPIDGTTNFIYDYHHSCISVGLALDGEMLFGVVYNPYVDEMYIAQKGQGAFLNGRQIHCSYDGLDRNMIAFGCARYNTDDTDRIFAIAKELYLNSMAIRNGGSSTLDICRCASGANGIYIELKLYPWDYAAASLILTEAGGVITQLDGSPVSLQEASGVLAGGAKCWEEALSMI
ncbi:MAG: inositol monophosphatase family protein [Hespellia sp.]|nr:inositol monophosphatase family protein [Hespellia sp.]